MKRGADPTRRMRAVLAVALLFAAFASPALADQSGTLQWTPASGPVFAYQVFRSDDGAAFTVDATPTGTSTPVTIATGTEAVFKVRAIAADGRVGPMSGPSAAIPGDVEDPTPLGQPGDVTVIIISPPGP